MRGITHFLSGIALATCFPTVVEMAQSGSLLPVLGGVGGLLPDVLDFRFARYWERYDVEVDPGPVFDQATARAAAENVVEALVRAMDNAYERRQSQCVMLHTIRVGSDLWRRYMVRFVPEDGVVAVRMGPVVTTSQTVLPGTDVSDGGWSLRRLGQPFMHSYSRQYNVDIFTGPSFRFTRRGQHLTVEFLPWHRRWSHSLFLAMIVGIGVGLVSSLFWETRVALGAGGLMALGGITHILEDQLGYMGSSLWWPFIHQRVSGLHLLHANEAVPNFLTVWTSLMLMLFNLDRFGNGADLFPLGLFLLLMGLPWLAFGVIRSIQRRHSVPDPATDEVWGEAERLTEIQQGELD